MLPPPVPPVALCTPAGSTSLWTSTPALRSPLLPPHYSPNPTPKTSAGPPPLHLPKPPPAPTFVGPPHYSPARLPPPPSRRSPSHPLPHIPSPHLPSPLACCSPTLPSPSPLACCSPTLPSPSPQPLLLPLSPAPSHRLPLPAPSRRTPLDALSPSPSPFRSILLLPTPFLSTASHSLLPTGSSPPQRGRVNGERCLAGLRIAIAHTKMRGRALLLACG